MSVEAFLDTNVLVYAAAGRGAEERKPTGTGTGKQWRSLKLFPAIVLRR